MTTALIPLDTLGATIRAHIEKGDASIEKAEQHYKSAGLHLAEAKARVKQTPGLTWPRFLLEHCQIRRARADELIMIADGRTTLADLRMKKAESVRAMRERQREDLPLRSGEPVAAITETVTSPDAHPDGEVARLKAEIEVLKKKLEKAEKAAAENASLASMREVRANEAEAQRDQAQHEALFYKSDKEHLAAELEDMREEITRLKEPGVITLFNEAYVAPAVEPTPWTDDDAQFMTLQSVWSNSSPEAQRRFMEWLNEGRAAA